MSIRSIRVTFFFTVHPFYEYVQSNQSNTRDPKKPSQAQTFFIYCSSLFLRASVSSLPNKESYDETIDQNRAMKGLIMQIPGGCKAKVKTFIQK